jgi:hypothetical protein
MVRAIGTAVSVLLLLGVFGFALLGCGDSGSDTPSAAQLERAKEEGERAALERMRVEREPEPVERMERSETKPLQTFHTPSGNVSCAITADGAFCTVNSLATTFRIEGGGPGQVESGSALAVESGKRADYGSTISTGTISCAVPRKIEARGVTCSDVSSGHGFEASLVKARQRTY